jgi:membrane protein
MAYAPLAARILLEQYRGVRSAITSCSPSEDSAEHSTCICLDVARLREYWRLLVQAYNAWNEDYASSMGAALAYYTVFSLAPLLILVIAVAGSIFGQEAARGEIVSQLGGVMGDDGARVLQDLLESASKPSSSTLASILGLATLIVGATSVLAELQSALDRIWRAPAIQQTSGVIAMIRTRLLSFGMVIALGFLLLVSLVVGAALSALGKWGVGLFPGAIVALQVLNLALGFLVTTLLFAMAYQILPRVKIAWSDVWTGSIVTAALFTVGKYLIGVYLGRAGVASGFGAAGSFVVLLVWVYYSAQIFLLGAEFTWVYAHRHGSKQQESVRPRSAATRQQTGPPDLAPPRARDR